MISGPFLFKYPKKSSEPESGNESTEDQEERIQDDSTTVDTETNKQNLKQELLATFNRFEVILFISTVLVTGLLQGVYINFTALRMQELNSPTFLIGLTISVAAICCLPSFLLSTKLIKFFGGYWPTLWFCCFSYAIRFVAFGMIDNPWLAVPINTLQTFGFALNLVTCILSLIHI